MLRLIVTSYLLLIAFTVSTKTMPLTTNNAWKIPTLENYELALEQCQLQSTESVYVQCIMSALELWNDSTGYNVQRILKIFAKKQMPVELNTVIQYCNESQWQQNKAEWAYNAYKCATVGRLGQWVQEYLKQLYNTKNKAKKIL